MDMKVTVSIEDLAKLGALDYAQTRKDSAKILGIGLAELDKAVNLLKAKEKADYKQRELDEAKAKADAAARVWIDKLANLPPSSCALADGTIFEVREDGLYCDTPPDSKGNVKSAWLCGKFEITHSTRSFENGEWGRVIKWLDRDGTEHTLPILMSSLALSPAEIWASLSEGGLVISPNRQHRDLLATYIQILITAKNARTVTKTGWVDGGKYVMQSGEIVGQDVDQEEILYHGNTIKNAVSGDVESWKSSVGRMAKGNSRLMFSIACAFAAPLLKMVGESGGGFNLRGASSVGKTTALRVATSVFGSELKGWRATGNGLEAVAYAHNDNLLVLDEINQCSPFEVGDVAYMLANGSGKIRAKQNGLARSVACWKTLFLSSGEQDIESILSSVNKKTMAGMELRLLSIPADAGKEMGLIEELNGFKRSGDLADAIVSASCKNFGAVGKEWLNFIADKYVHEDAKLFFTKRVDALALSLVTPEDLGQIRRAARRFAVVAAAGEAVCGLGLVGWSKEEVRQAVATCFDAWKANFQPENGGNKEQESIVNQTLAFLQTAAATRFQNLANDNSFVVRDRAGFLRFEDDAVEYLIFPDVFKREIGKGFDVRDVTKILAKDGMLQKFGRDFTTKVNLPGLGRQRVYIARINTEKEEVTNENF